MINLYWPIYKNIENELILLSNQIHFDDKQLNVYSIKISELLIRCAVEIEAISKDLFFRVGGTVPPDGTLYFDTHCLQLLEERWLLSRKTLILSASNFYFENRENRIITPLLNANRRGKCDWKKAYQAVKHNRTNDLQQGNIKNLLKALGALFILNIYYKNIVYNLERDNTGTNFIMSLGSDIFNIKLHRWAGYDGNHNYIKKNDFEECMYIVKETDKTFEHYKTVTSEMFAVQRELFTDHPKVKEFISGGHLKNYKGHNLWSDILDEDEYWQIIHKSTEEQIKAIQDAKYEAVLNFNTI